MLQLKEIGRIGAVFVLGVLGGCASSPRATENVEAAPILPAAVNGYSGATATIDDLASAADGADVLILGENHGHAAGLAFAAEVWRGVVERSPTAALALEFFNRDDQAHLDDYLGGLTQEAAFRTATRRTDGNYPAGHRAMVEAAKAAERPVFAANAPRVYTRLANREGFDRLRSLSESQRRLFAVPRALPQGRYRDDFFGLMSSMPSHTAGPPKKGDPPPVPPSAEAIEGMFRAQSVWDWTMAQTLARARDAGHRPVVLVVGRFHSDFRGGLVQALEHLRPGTRIVTVSFVASAPGALRDEDRERADFVVYAGEGASGP